MVEDIRPTQKQLFLKIPREYHGEPVISNLVSQYHLTVNITAAILGAHGGADGWFDLTLHGTKGQIDSALAYINDLNLEIWNNIDDDSW
jgi:hypothetical protein